MKKLILVASLSLSAVAFGTSVSDVVVRQQWPWKTTVNVDFVVSGSSGALEQVLLKAYRGDQLLGYLPISALSGDVTVTADGEKRISFNPADVPFIASLPTMANFKLDVSIDAGTAKPLYMIFDLTKTQGQDGFLAYVTEEALTNGVWGSWRRGPCGMLPDSPIWTEVTNDVRYVTTHLVVRRIPAGTFYYGEDPKANDRWRDVEITNTTVTITKDYYIGVYKLTKAQYARLFDRTSTSDDTFPLTGKYYGSYTLADCIRGYANLENYNWPVDKNVRGSTIMGKLRSLTGLDFDLPTEAQWEKAARAGSSGPYYHTTATNVSEGELKKIAWFYGNSGDKYHEPGRLLPNDYGLYDVLGLATEQVLDWYVPSYTPAASDPEGPLSEPGGKLRVIKGGSFRSRAVISGTNYPCCLGGRGSLSYKEPGSSTGIRVCCPAE